MPFDLLELKFRIIRRFGTLTAFAKEMGCTQRYISMLVAGDRKPSKNFLSRMAFKLNLPQTKISAVAKTAARKRKIAA